MNIQDTAATSPPSYSHMMTLIYSVLEEETLPPSSGRSTTLKMKKKKRRKMKSKWTEGRINNCLVIVKEINE